SRATPTCIICEKTCANRRRSVTTDISLSCRNFKACNHKSIHLSNLALSANIAPLNTIGCGSSGLWRPETQTRTMLQVVHKHLFFLPLSFLAFLLDIQRRPHVTVRHPLLKASYHSHSSSFALHTSTARAR
ncbi:hypothetical protein ALC56_15187, partial [Trachymyrmex septentrionalis]